MIDEHVLNIFTIYYKRIMRVEAALKSHLIIQYSNLYNKNNVYKITYAQFFSKVEKNKHSADTIYTKLYKSNKTEEEKFKQAIEKMYLSEIINFLGHPVFLKSKLRKTFFNIETDTKTTEFQSNSKNLNLFRNSIAHIDFKKFSLDKTRFLNALNYFERILGFDNIITIESLNTINPKHKLSTMDILKLIYKIDSKIFNDDKVLISIFDEIALLNGYSYEGLPQRWTIIRQKFKLEKDFKIHPSCDLVYDSKQLKLDF